MPRCIPYVVLLLTVLANPVSSRACVNAPCPQARSTDWLFEQDGELYIRIHLTILLPDGSPATKINARVDYPIFRAAVADERMDVPIESSVEPAVEGNKVALTLKARRAHDHSFTLIVESDDERHIQYSRISAGDIRNIAMNGREIVLQPFRKVRCRVIGDQGKTIPDSRVYVGRTIVQTDSNGLATFSFPGEEWPIRFATAITEDLRFGKTRFALDESGDQVFDIVVGEGVKQTVKAIDSQDKPLIGLMLQPQRVRNTEGVPVAGYPAFTDEQGEVEWIWRPEHPQGSSKMQIHGDRWMVRKESRSAEQWVLNLDPVERATIAGKLELPENMPGGFMIELVSFDHPIERRIDRVLTRCDNDGQFTADLIIDATYGVYIQDPSHVSSFWTGIIEDESTKPTLNLETAVPVKVICTRGSQKVPIQNESLSIQIRYAVSAEGTGRTRTTGPSYQVVTGEDGTAKFYCPAGSAAISLRLPDHQEQNRKIMVQADSENAIELHVPSKR